MSITKNHDLNIIYEDDAIIVCHKEAGVPVQTSDFRVKDMVSILKNYRVLKKEAPYIGVVNRLDQPVEGLVIFAKNEKAAAVLSAQIARTQEGKAAEKEYLAVLTAVPEKPEGRVEDHLLKDGRTNTSSVVKAGTKGAKKAVLTYKTEKIIDDRALVRVKLETGRHHQIRVQMANLGCPISGDSKYGQKSDKYMPVALCSVKLGIIHPETGKKMVFETEPTGEAFKSFL